ncbi:fructokinase-like 2, chloroplastic [Hordeum vulgare]|nr:fructokinase-like 2, chloroplastic [Hordeum vulgare]
MGLLHRNVSFVSKKSSQDVEEGSSGEDSDAGTPKTKKKHAKRGRKKATKDTSDGHGKEGQSDTEDASLEEPKIVKMRGRKKAKYSFIHSGRPANRMVDRETHSRMKDMFWSPDEFVRAPGGSSSNVALALAALGGRVVFMGKLGDDEYGQRFSTGVLNWKNTDQLQWPEENKSFAQESYLVGQRMSASGEVALGAPRLLPYHSVTQPHNTHLDEPPPRDDPVPRTARAHADEVRRWQQKLTPKQWHNPVNVADSPKWEAWFA